jgi:hypothetical protein
MIDILSICTITMPSIQHRPTEAESRWMRSQYAVSQQLEYYDLLEKTDQGQKLHADLKADPRVIKLSGQMLNRGNGAHLFCTFALGSWFLWYAAKTNHHRAYEALNAYLDDTEINILVTLWLLGISVSDTMDLGDGVMLVPVSQMPESSATMEAKVGRWVNRPFGGVFPQAALVKTVRVPKVAPPMHAKQRAASPSADALLQLQTVALMLNALEDISVEPNYTTAYTEPHVPLGPFAGSGGSRQLFDVTTRTNQPVSQISREELARLLEAHKRLAPEERKRFDLILLRLAQAKRRVELPDKILDLGVALEMLLLHGGSSREQLSLQFRLRGSWLLGMNAAERLHLLKEFKEVYDMRSQVAHSGHLKKSGAVKDLREKIKRFERLSCRVFRQLLISNDPDWDRMLLGHP